MMQRTMLFATVFLLMSGMALAQAPDNTGADQAPEDVQPSVPDRPSTSPDKGVSGAVNALPLPDQASDTASQVLNTIVDTPAGQLGEALQNLLGTQEDEPGNETTE